MEVPEELGEKIYKTLIKLYADQMGVTIKCEMEVRGKKVEIDTSKLLFSKEQ